MTGAPGAPIARGVRRDTCDILVGGFTVSVATSNPRWGAVLSTAACRLAEDLLATTSDIPRRDIRVASLLPSGRPVAIGPAGPLPFSVSVSHVPGLVAAAVARGTCVGIDVVDLATVRSGIRFWLDGSDRLGETSPGMLWAAKEAAYKAAGIDAPFRPLAVEIEADDEGFAWRLRDRWRGASGAGRFVLADRHVVAVACATATSAAGEGPSCS